MPFHHYLYLLQSILLAHRVCYLFQEYHHHFQQFQDRYSFYHFRCRLINDHRLLHQNFPNPFNPITTLRYDLSSDALVTLSIYDMLGREITQLVNTTQKAGFKSVKWNSTASMGRPVSAGVYLYRIQAGEFVQTKKMVLLK